MKNESCSHGKRAPFELLESLPKYQAGVARHKCAICAYAAGRFSTPRSLEQLDVAKIINELDILKDTHLRVRASFPVASYNMVGEYEFSTAPYYRSFGHSITFKLAEPLQESTIDEMHRLGYWLNQNFILRLWAVLESNGVIGGGIKIIENVNGAGQLKVLPELRNIFSHGAGVYDPTKDKHKKLRNRILKYFTVTEAEHPESNGRFPIPIHEVLVPLLESAARYVRVVGNGSLTTA